MCVYIKSDLRSVTHMFEIHTIAHRLTFPILRFFLLDGAFFF